MTLMYMAGQEKSGRYSSGRRKREMPPSTITLMATMTVVIGLRMGIFGELHGQVLKAGGERKQLLAQGLI